MKASRPKIANSANGPRLPPRAGDRHPAQFRAAQAGSADLLPGADGAPVYLRDIWPSTGEINEVINQCLWADMFTRGYADVFSGDDNWRSLDVASGQRFGWNDSSSYVRRPPYFDGMPREREPIRDITGARALAVLGDSVTTDHISPAGAIKADGPAGSYLTGRGVARVISTPTGPAAATTR